MRRPRDPLGDPHLACNRALLEARAIDVGMSKRYAVPDALADHDAGKCSCVGLTVDMRGSSG
jgi:hypothetical protein